MNFLTTYALPLTPRTPKTYKTNTTSICYTPFLQPKSWTLIEHTQHNRMSHYQILMMPLLNHIYSNTFEHSVQRGKIRDSNTKFEPHSFQFVSSLKSASILLCDLYASASSFLHIPSCLCGKIPRLFLTPNFFTTFDLQTLNNNTHG